MMVDIAAVDIASKDKTADLVGRERYIDRLAGFNAIGNVNAERL